VMNLEVRLLVRPDGTAAFALCDAEGRMLPMQESVEIAQFPEDDARLTVGFVVDGERVRLTSERVVGEPAAPAPETPPGDGSERVVPIRRGRGPKPDGNAA
jgi:hypothetical protein